MFAGVPKVYERIRDGVKMKTKGIAGKILEAGLKAKSKDLTEGCGYLSLYDVVFNKSKVALGGRCRFMITGGAPISADTLLFLRCAFGPVIQGYGATETAAASTLTLGEDTTFGHVGPPMPQTMIKLVDVPEMGYLSATDDSVYEGHIAETQVLNKVQDGRKFRKSGGEIWIRGAGVSSGYYDPSVDDPKRGVPTNGMAAKTQEDFLLEDGYYWFKTGDIGNMNPSGTLSIRDRKKNIFKLSIGEYIAVEKVEQTFQDNCSAIVDFVYVPKKTKNVKGTEIAYIGCCCVVGEGTPAMGAVKTWAAENGMAGKDITTIIASKEFHKEVFDRFKKAGKAKGLFPFELIQKEHYLHCEYNPDFPDRWMEGVELEGSTPGETEKLLTATQKARRTQLDMHWEKQYTKMYID